MRIPTELKIRRQAEACMRDYQHPAEILEAYQTIADQHRAINQEFVEVERKCPKTLGTGGCHCRAWPRYQEFIQSVAAVNRASQVLGVEKSLVYQQHLTRLTRGRLARIRYLQADGWHSNS